jgi:hypothetical protein
MSGLPLDNPSFRLALEAAFHAKHYDELVSAGKSLRQFGYKIVTEKSEVYLEKIEHASAPN